MYTHRFRAALAAAAILLPLRAAAAIPHGADAPLPKRLRADRGRLKLVGPDGVPGKAVPRYSRVFPASHEALRQALVLVRPDQGSEATHLRVGPFDDGRREMLSFQIPTEQLVAMAAEPELELKAENARMRPRGRAMDMLRDVARRVKPVGAGAR